MEQKAVDSVVSTMLGKCAATPYFTLFGVLAASYLGLKFTKSVLSGIFTFVLGKGLNLKKYGEWAVVTGATDGIGKAYAQELARSGLNVVLISRTLEKLEDVAAEIRSKYNVQTKVIAADFTGGVEIYDAIKSGLAGLKIGTLVNNVGMSYSHPDYVAEVEEKKFVDMINCNVLSLTMMIRIVLPQMVERRGGAIINLASASAVAPTPLLTAYSASKAYVDFFSQALQAEYADKGIIVQSVLPYFVATKMSKIRRASFFVPDPTSYVRSALRTLSSQSRTFGCLSHALQGYVLSLLPGAIVNRVTLSKMKAVRAKAIKRQQKAQ